VLTTTGPTPDDVSRYSGSRPDHPWFSEGTPLICSIANIIRRKRQDILIRALPLVREEIHEARLVLVGRFDDQEYLNSLRALAEELAVSEQTSFAGYAPVPFPFLFGCQVFVHAAESEGGGRVILEALACGAPVIAADSPGGNSFSLDGGRVGLLVPPGDPAAFAAAIVKLLRDDRLRAEMIDRGKERAAAFTPEKVAGAYLRLAQELSPR
jgi:glycosyltransferase involved in cell wall biosynthesis